MENNKKLKELQVRVSQLASEIEGALNQTNKKSTWDNYVEYLSMPEEERMKKHNCIGIIIEKADDDNINLSSHLGIQIRDRGVYAMAQDTNKWERINLESPIMIGNTDSPEGIYIPLCSSKDGLDIASTLIDNLKARRTIYAEIAGYPDYEEDL